MSPIITGIGIGVSFDGAGDGDIYVPITPPDQANLRQWFDAGIGITLNGSGVAEWANQSGNNGKKLGQATPADQPIFTAEDPNFNNRPSIGFDGVSHFMQTVAFDTAIDIPGTVIIVQKKDVLGATVLFDGIDANDRWIFWNENSMSLAAGGFNLTTSITTDLVILSLSFNTGSGPLTPKGWHDGVLAGSGLLNHGTSTLLGGLTLATKWDGTAPWDGHIAEILIYDKILSLASHNDLGSQLADKYGLTWTDIV